MYARFLEAAAARFRVAAGLWSGVAERAMPDSHPLLGRAREILAEKNRLFEEQGGRALPEMRRLNGEMEEILARWEVESGDLTGLLADLQEGIRACLPVEAEAFHLLEAAV